MSDEQVFFDTNRGRNALDDGTREDPWRHVPRGARDQRGIAQGGLYGEADRVSAARIVSNPEAMLGKPASASPW